MKSIAPTLTTPRIVEIFHEMVSCRRIYCDGSDARFFKMTEFWEWLAGDQNDGIRIKTYNSDGEADYKRKAGVVAFGNLATLVVDQKLLSNARRGCKLSNFLLAHEFSHLALGHHDQGAVIKNFQLYSGPNGMMNVPPTKEELEANIAATFFQCGTALLDDAAEPLQLAHQAFTDVLYVKKCLGICGSNAFMDELEKRRVQHERVVL